MFRPVWHHRCLEILQNKMSMWLHSNLKKPEEYVSLQREWILIKQQVDTSFAVLDKEYLKLSKSDSKSS